VQETAQATTVMAGGLDRSSAAGREGVTVATDWGGAGIDEDGWGLGYGLGREDVKW
jgi:hypothetical protein